MDIIIGNREKWCGVAVWAKTSDRGENKKTKKKGKVKKSFC